MCYFMKATSQVQAGNLEFYKQWRNSMITLKLTPSKGAAKACYARTQRRRFGDNWFDLVRIYERVHVSREYLCWSDANVTTDARIITDSKLYLICI